MARKLTLLDIVDHICSKEKSLSRLPTRQIINIFVELILEKVILEGHEFDFAIRKISREKGRTYLRVRKTLTKNPISPYKHQVILYVPKYYRCPNVNRVLYLNYRYNRMLKKEVKKGRVYYNTYYQEIQNKQ